MTASANSGNLATIGSNPGNDTHIGSNAADTITTCNDAFPGRDGHDSLLVRAGTDVLFGDANNDRLDDGSGRAFAWPARLWLPTGGCQVLVTTRPPDRLIAVNAAPFGVAGMPTTFIFVHGAFGSPAELAPTAPCLESRGHRVVIVDLPSERPDATLDDYASTVGRAMEHIPGPRILVAHSAGGATIPLVAARIAVDRLVFAAAVVPVPGQSIYEAVGPDTQAAIMSVSIDNGDGTRSFDFDLLSSLVPPEHREAYLAFLRSTQRKQGMRAVNQPWPGIGIPHVPSTYILCTEDRIIPPDRQRTFAASLGVTPIEIASEHSVFATKPQELAGILHSVAD